MDNVISPFEKIQQIRSKISSEENKEISDIEFLSLINKRIYQSICIAEECKKRSYLVALKYETFDIKKYEKILNCYNIISLITQEHYISKKQRQKILSYRCKTPFCPVCQRIRSINYINALEVQLINIAENMNKDFLFITLSVPNCTVKDFKKTHKNMMFAFEKMFRTAKFKRNYEHYIRVTEFTYNKERNDINLHFHVIVSVEKNYFRKTNKDYINDKEKELARIWTGYFKNVTEKTPKEELYFTGIKKVYSRQKLNNDDRLSASQKKVRSALKESVKYIAKSNDILDMPDNVFKSLNLEIKDIRFITTSRNIKLDVKKLDDDYEENLKEKIKWITLYIDVLQFDKKDKKYTYKKTDYKTVGDKGRQIHEAFLYGWKKMERRLEKIFTKKD